MTQKMLPPNVNSLGELLHSRRSAMGYTRAELAEKTGLSAISIAKYEKAGLPSGQFPPLPKLVKLAVELEIDGNWILLSCLEDDDDLERFNQTSFGKNVTANLVQDTLSALFAGGGKLDIQGVVEQVNKKPEEASLATSSPGSNPNQTSLAKKENEDGSEPI